MLILNEYQSSCNGLVSTLNEKTIHQRCTNVLLYRSIQIFRRLLPRFNKLSLLFTPKPLQFTQF